MSNRSLTPTVELRTVLRWACSMCGSEYEVLGAGREGDLRAMARAHLTRCVG